MKPPSRVSYALRALVDLALHQASGPVRIAAVAKRQGLPVRYLEQLLHRLKRAGIVEAERGPRGGYRLKLPADQISVSTIFRSLEPADLLPRTHPKGRTPTPDPTAAVWRQMEAAVETTLTATTLETLISQIKENAASPNHRYTFHI